MELPIIHSSDEIWWTLAILVPELPVFTNFYAFAYVWLHCDHAAKQVLTGHKLSTMRHYVLLYSDISIYDHIWRTAARSGQFWRIKYELLRMSFDAKQWQTLHNTASNGPVWPHLDGGDHVWSTIWSMNHLVLIEVKVINLGLRDQVMAGMARWCKIEQIWPNVA